MTEGESFRRRINEIDNVCNIYWPFLRSIESLNLVTVSYYYKSELIDIDTKEYATFCYDRVPWYIKNCGKAFRVCLHICVHESETAIFLVIALIDVSSFRNSRSYI